MTRLYPAGRNQQVSPGTYAKQIRLAFEQAERKVSDLHQRTAEGIETARLAGKQIGQKPGAKLTTKKSLAAKEIIQKHNKSFGGSADDPAETIRQAEISRKTFLQVQERAFGIYQQLVRVLCVWQRQATEHGIFLLSRSVLFDFKACL